MKKINIYVGKNNSGKTFKLEKIKNECEDKCLYVPAEIICDAFYIKENQGNARKVDWSPHIKLIKLINNVFKNSCEKHLIKLSSDEINHAKSMRDLINATLNDLNHKYIDANFKDSFVVDQKKYADMSVENSGVEIELDEIIKFEGKNSNFSSSSGVQIFTLLNILSKFIQIDNDKIKNEIINGYHLIIDEPEKFLHNELLMKVAETICALSKIIEVSIATHSLQLLTHFILLSKKENYDVNLRVCYIDETQTDNKHKITEPIDIGILKNQNQNNVIARIMNCFFSTNIILVEGPYDESVFYDLLLDELFKNKLWTIIVCDGKRNLKPRYDTIRSLNIPNLQVIPIYDSDGSSPLNLSNNDIVFDGKIENNFFEVEGENYKIKDNLLEIKLVCKDALWCRILNGSKNSIENIRSLSTKTNINEIIDKLKTKLGEILVE